MDYREVNRQSWNMRLDAHLQSAFYDNDSFLNGRNSLNSIELGLLGDLKDKSVLHLQCHFGQDTISLTRLGAEAVGVDLSDQAIDKARELARATNSSARFICSDVYDLPNHLQGQFDIVFTSYGVINWLPDLDKWAKVVSHFLKPGGHLVLVEFHPVVWMFNDDFTQIQYSYFNSGPIHENEENTYTDTEEAIAQQSITWNHGLGDVVNSLLAKGLSIDSLTEYNYSPYDCFNESEELEPGKFRIKQLGNKIPMVYAITAFKTK